jgi:hypothetical protein
MGLNDYCDKILVINLPTSTRRRESIIRNFEQRSIKNYEFVDGVEGLGLDTEALKLDGTLDPKTWDEGKLSLGELGNTLAHIRAWKAAIERGYERVLIAEDDVYFNEDVHSTIDKAISQIPGGNSGWDCLYLFSYIPIGCGRFMDPYRKRLSANVVRAYDEGRGAIANLYTLKALKWLVSIAFPVKTTSDGITNWLSGYWEECKGWRSYLVVPFPCKTAGFCSENDIRGGRAGSLNWLNTSESIREVAKRQLTVMRRFFRI